MKGYQKEPKPPTFTVSRAWGSTGVEERMYAQHHPYKTGPGRCAIHYHAKEGDTLIAVFSFKPPAYGAAVKVSPSNPHEVIALSRMCAVPKEQRKTKHISKMMRALWNLLPDNYRVVVSYSDSSCGHTGYVYQCAGFTKEDVIFSKYYVDCTGDRVSCNTNGKRNPNAIYAGTCLLTRWTLRIRDDSGARVY